MVTKMKNFLKFKTGEGGVDMRKFGEEFYLREARLWRPFRWAGMFSTALALVLVIASVFNKYWLAGTGVAHAKTVVQPTSETSNVTEATSAFESGLFDSACSMIDVTFRPPDCSDSLPSFNILPQKQSTLARNSKRLCNNWQKAVIGLMIFSAVFGFVAAVLAICGVCTSPLPKKIYYFHSAGEIFFVCAMSSTIALIVYAVAISTDATIGSHTYGSGYGLGWGGTAFYYAASFCMSLDELVRESAQNKCCRAIFWRSRNSEDDNSHPV